MINKEVLLTSLNLIMITFYYTDVVGDDDDDADDDDDDMYHKGMGLLPTLGRRGSRTDSQGEGRSAMMMIMMVVMMVMKMPRGRQTPHFAKRHRSSTELQQLFVGSRVRPGFTQVVYLIRGNGVKMLLWLLLLLLLL